MTVASTTPTTAASAGSSSSASSPSALSSLSGNLTDFLKLLMTQLQNQDPSSPMDTSTFTSQLVQYASVEQQINANTNLQTLIQSSQSQMILQSSSLVGKQVDVKSSNLSLQNGQAVVKFTDAATEPVNVSIYDASGTKIFQTTAAAQAGSNTWVWNGQDASGNQLKDGSYKILVNQSNGNALTTTVTGTVTGVQRSGSSVNIDLGALSTDIANVQSVGS